MGPTWKEGQAAPRRRQQPSSRILTAWKGPYSITYAERPAEHRSVGVLGDEKDHKEARKAGRKVSISRPVSKPELADTVERGQPVEKVGNELIATANRARGVPKCGSAQQTDTVKVSREFMERPTEVVCYAA